MDEIQHITTSGSLHEAGAPNHIAPAGRMPTIAQGQLHRPRWHNYTAFVLAGGGARGAFQVGALKALIEHGVRPDVLVGTSIGSWNGAWLARNPTGENADELVETWRGLTTLQVLLGVESRRQLPQASVGMRLLMAARRLARGYPSLYDDRGLRQLIGRHLGDSNFESMAVPLRIIATDLTRGTRAVFTNGPVMPAILASSAMPGVFPPVCIDNHVYVDGGALDNCSLETAVKLGARRIFVIDVDSSEFDEPATIWCNDVTPAQLRESGSSAHAMALVLQRMTQVVCRYQFEQAIQRLPRGIEVHVLRPGRDVAGGVLDFDRSSEWIDHAYAVTRDYLRARLPVPQPVANAS